MTPFNPSSMSFDSPYEWNYRNHIARKMFSTKRRAFLITFGVKHPEQLGFGFDAIQEQQETDHLPSSMVEGVSLYRGMLEKNHQAMLAGDEKTAMAMRKDANRLTVKLNGGDPRILGGPDAPGHILCGNSRTARHGAHVGAEGRFYGQCRRHAGAYRDGRPDRRIRRHECTRILPQCRRAR
jgi:hypothetical protein